MIGRLLIFINPSALTKIGGIDAAVTDDCGNILNDEGKNQRSNRGPAEMKSFQAKVILRFSASQGGFKLRGVFVTLFEAGFNL